jgi:hypothetical protein
MQNESLFANMVMRDPKEKAAMQKAVVTCLQNPNSPDCDEAAKVRMLRAMIQYNLGRDVKSMVLQNSTNEENMKSVPTPRNKNDRLFQGKKVRSLYAGNTFTSSFKITARDMATSLRWDRKQLEDVSKLGQNFRNEYEKFIDTYSSTVNTEDLNKDRWHFAHARAPARRGKDPAMVWKLDPSTNSPELVRDRQFWDQETQDRPVVHQAVAWFKKELSNPEIKVAEDGAKKDPNSRAPATQPKVKKLEGVNFEESLHFSALGLGSPQLVKDPETGKIISSDPNVVNAHIVAKLNKAVDDSAKAKARQGMRVTDTRINVDTFDAYLDQIWPKTGYQYRIPRRKNKKLNLLNPDDHAGALVGIAAGVRVGIGLRLAEGPDLVQELRIGSHAGDAVEVNAARHGAAGVLTFPHVPLREEAAHVGNQILRARALHDQAIYGGALAGRRERGGAGFVAIARREFHVGKFIFFRRSGHLALPFGRGQKAIGGDAAQIRGLGLGFHLEHLGEAAFHESIHVHAAEGPRQHHYREEAYAGEKGCLEAQLVLPGKILPAHAGARAAEHRQKLLIADRAFDFNESVHRQCPHHFLRLPHHGEIGFRGILLGVLVEQLIQGHPFAQGENFVGGPARAQHLFGGLLARIG